jgi:hypothetical protein
LRVNLRKIGRLLQVRVETVPGQLHTSSFASAYAIAEFMLNLRPMREPPSRDTLAEYVRANFQRANGAFQFSCDQDFARISRSDHAA